MESGAWRRKKMGARDAVPLASRGGVAQKFRSGCWLAVWLLWGTGCIGTHESAVRRDVAAARERYHYGEARARSEERQRPVPGTRTPDAEGHLSAYVARAFEQSPSVRAAFERWRASVHRISEARTLPAPTLGFGYFIRSVETRVGPQRARLSLQQAFPWPTQLSAGADAAAARARSVQRQFESQTLSIARRVAVAYWSLWQVRAVRAVRQEHLALLGGLSESLRARLSTGRSSLADLQQVDLTAARLEDAIAGLDEAERVAEAQLRAAIGADDQLALPTSEAPAAAVSLPSARAEALREAVREHPRVTSAGLLAEAAESTARAEAADRYPSFALGADWIITGEAAADGLRDSGKDAVIVSGGIRLPLWQGQYADGVAAARAEADAHRAEQRALVDQALAELATALSDLRDAARRAQLYRNTLVPQARSTYESVLGTLAVGEGSIAQALLAERDLLDLRVELLRARADHARAHARLEEVTGREVALRPGPGEKVDDDE